MYLVIQVEAVADAYMVVSGVADGAQSHAERIANTALGMLISAQEVKSPYDYGDKDNHVKVRLLTPSEWVIHWDSQLMSAF